jgi:hypothetical protein
MNRGQKEMRETLIAERDKLLRQRDALENEIKGLERAISLVSGAEPLASTKPGGKRTDLKGVVLGLLQEVGTSGLNAAIAVELANRRGVTLNQNSVSALLSRLKADGVLSYDGDRYRLASLAEAAADPFRMAVGDNVTPFGSARQF